MKDNIISRTSIILIGFVLLLMIVQCVTASGPQTGHPYLLFHNISEVPGYQNRALDPWKGWEATIITGANGSLSRNFSSNLGDYDRVLYRGQLAQNLGMAYQITKKPEYAQKTKEALLNLEVGTIGGISDSNAVVRAKNDKAGALEGYSLAYDWVQPTLDPATDRIIRDKLAVLADTVYKDLNDNGTNRGYVSFPDHHGQAYPAMGVASAVLYDYTNPNNLTLSSTPGEWHRVGTEYLFENDLLHSYGRSLFSFGFDEVSGKNFMGAYKAYVMDDLALWFQVSNHVYGEKLLEKYPAAKKAFTSEEWESLPNDYSDNYVTNGNIKWTYQKTIVSLLPDTEKSAVLNHLDRIESSKILPYTQTNGGPYNTGDMEHGISPSLLYCVYGNYTAIPRSFPANTSHLDPHAITQVFRENWNDDSDWLSLITFNSVTLSNRDAAHHDQLSFEYYSRGDLLLADGGEEKFVLDKYYGTSAISHNTVAVENPRSPFPKSPMTGSSSLGIYKGNTTGPVTQTIVDTIVQVPWMQALQTHASIKELSLGTTREEYNTQSLSSPIRYSRIILYPESDYFIIVDRMEGTETWTYRNIFRPTSLMVTPTVDTNNDGIYTASEVGHVNGSLTIGSTPYNWLGLPYKNETATGKTTNTISWATKNPYAKDVRLDLVSAPASEILVTKHVGRIGGYGPVSEVYNPVVYLKSPPAKTLYRVTALLSRYTSEEAKSASTIPVQGNGNALKVHASLYDDYIYTGKGTSSFATFTTDADTAFIRKTGNITEYTLINGSYLKEGSTNLVSVSKNVDYFTLKKVNNIVKFKINTPTNVDIILYNIIPISVKRDGVPYTNWIMQNNATQLKISTDLNEHEFEILSDDIPAKDYIGIFYPSTGNWYLDYNGNGIWDAGTDKVYNFGTADWTPVLGNWNGDGKSKVGVFKDGTWYLDYNGNGIWDAGTDKVYNFGTADWTPVLGNWNGAATGTKIGIYKDGIWYLDMDGSGTWNAGDRASNFGTVGWTPVVGNWNGAATGDKIGIFKDGTWYLDNDGSGTWNAGDRANTFGTVGWTPVLGNWNGDTTGTKIGIYKDGTWYLDYNGNEIWDAGTDRVYNFGTAGWTSVIGDWNGDGKSKVGVFKDGTWYLDYNSNGIWNAGTDKVYNFGTAGWTSVDGKWS